MDKILQAIESINGEINGVVWGVFGLLLLVRAVTIMPVPMSNTKPNIPQTTLLISPFTLAIASKILFIFMNLL